jgi:hypothetical protein
LLGCALGAGAATLCLDRPEELRDVVWEDESPYCPHCRTDVNWYSTTCYTCFSAYRWRPDEKECPYCISKVDIEWMKKTLDDDPDSYRAALESLLRGLALPPDVVAATLPDLILFVKSLEPGACTFCAGTGRWLAPALAQARCDPDDPLFSVAVRKLDGACPVCLGTGRCIVCGGDRVTEEGVEAAKIAVDESLLKLSHLNPERDEASALERFRIVRAVLEEHEGALRIADLSSLYSLSDDQANWALVRRELVSGALSDDR